MCAGNSDLGGAPCQATHSRSWHKACAVDGSEMAPMESSNFCGGNDSCSVLAEGVEKKDYFALPDPLVAKLVPGINVYHTTEAN